MAHSEDDTFRILKRTPFSEMKNMFFSGEEYRNEGESDHEWCERHGWTWKEFWNEAI